MMNKINQLLQISEDLALNDISLELNYINDRNSAKNKELIIPVVGEFSSGKTTFINELTESKKLETASKATTSVIYEIYFNSESEFAEIVYENGEKVIVENIEEIKNDSLENVKLIRIFDKSVKLDRSTVLVDTPGLSSNNPKHIEALSRYLPNSDALLLFIDINQQITKSLLSFINTNNLLHLPIYLVITKKDTKTKDEVEKVKSYISKNIDLPLDNIISISSTSGDLDEFNELMKKVQMNKNLIVDNVLNYRLNKTSLYIKNYIENLISNSTSDDKLEIEIKSQRRKLERLNNAIDKLIGEVQNNLEDIRCETCSQFEAHIFPKLDSLLANNSQNLDNEAYGIINSVASVSFSNYENQVRKKLYEVASDRRNTELEIPLRSLESVDFSGLELGVFSYDINLGDAGKTQIKYISNGIKLAAIVAAVAVTAGAAAAAAPAVITAGGAGTVASATGIAASVGSIASGASVAVKAGTLINVADTASDLASIASNRSTKKMIVEQSKKAAEHFRQAQANIEVYNQYNSQVGQMITPNKNDGFVESIVGAATDGFLGKPQRKKLINNYLNDSLLPEFKNKLSIIGLNLLGDIQKSLNLEATGTVEQMESRLNELKDLYLKEKDTYNLYIQKLKNHLLTL